MSIATQITRLNNNINDLKQTKQDIKAAVNNDFNTISNEQIESYATKIEDTFELYKDFVANTASNKATELEINDAMVYSKNKIAIEGNTEQKTLTGKNLFKKIPNKTIGGIELTQLDNGIKLNGTSNASNYKTFPFETDIVLAAGTYTIYYKTTKIPINLSLYGENYSNIFDRNISQTYENVLTMTLSEEKTIKGFRIWIDNGTTFNNEFLQIMILEGNVSLANALPYEPYCGGIPSPNPDFPQQIKNVTGQANVKIQNKNLFNSNLMIKKPAWQPGNITIKEDGTIEISNNGGTPPTFFTKRLKEIAPEIKVGDTIWLYLQTTNSIKYVDCNGSWYNNTSKNITEAMLNAYFIIYGGNNGTDTFQLMLTKQQATSYVPHQEQNLPFSFKSKNLFDFEYVKNHKNDFYKSGTYFAFYELDDVFKTQFTVTTILKGTSQNLVMGFLNIISNAEASQSNYRNINRGTINSPKTYDYTNSEHVYLVVGNGNGLSQDLSEVDNLFNNYNIQVEIGTTATDYEPYYDIRAMQGTELLDDGIHNTRKQIEITSENVDTLVTTIGTLYNVSEVAIDKRNLGWKVAWTSGIAKINRYTEVTNVNNVASGTFMTNIQQYYLNIFDDRFVDLATAKSLLIGTVIEIEQAEEEIIPYNETQQTQYNAMKEIQSYKDINYISSESTGELAPNAQFIYKSLS